MRTKKKSASVDEAFYTQFDYEKHPSFFEDFKKRVVKKAVKIIDKIKENNRVANFGKARKKVAKRNAKKSK